MSDFLFTEEADIAGPSGLIMTRGNPEEEEDDEDSDTDDIDHTGEKRHTLLKYSMCCENKNVEV